MRATILISALGLVMLAPMAADAQGVVRGAQEGAAVGNHTAGPVGAAVGGAVGGVAGGVAGGVKGVLGVPQNTGTVKRHRASKRVKNTH
jgi:phage tail tape-measure protein